ncbi:MAG: UDP-N-acetylglucosamine--N-acetylmuramyl-(pentapeptide) pyrophosphoryl-undecaprenol N-acetylglucosamine transferase, partial [candidate division Zixibacteria bacterium]|nr:UDP-N-acetylglucosamine--N-acetylmuramyl-(pentapeptide) pyrophosphoryl-undecaprenol N-acetylglucosamine transferase [candidate division Zixibacteria bacterium]
VIQEQNSFPGLTTRRYANKVDRVYLGFGEALSHLKPGVKAVNTGNPVRDEIGLPSREEGLAHFQLSSSKKTILILGGSQGSRSINNSVLKDFENLSSECQLIWQTGQSDFESIRDKVGDRMEDGTLFAFHDRIELAYAAADIAIARAGALTIAELLVSETPALLAPYPHAAGDHQTKNAQMSLTRGVAEIVEDRNLNSENLIDKACQIAQSSKCIEMRDAIRKWNYERPPRASETICRDLVKLLRERGKLS